MAAVPDPVAGDSPNTKVACVQNKTKKALKELLKASSAGVVQGITVTLAFTMDGLTYTCALPVAKEKPSANEGFPELFNLMERETNAPRSAAFLSLVTGTVVREWVGCMWAFVVDRTVFAGEGDKQENRGSKESHG